VINQPMAAAAWTVTRSVGAMARSVHRARPNLSIELAGAIPARGPKE